MEIVIDREKWERKQTEVFDRDGYKCLHCGKSNTTLMVLVFKYGKGVPVEDNPIDNMYTICRDCYKKL